MSTSTARSLAPTPPPMRDALVAAAQFFRLIDERCARAAGLTAVEARTLHAIDVVGLTRGITSVGWMTGVLQPAATASVRRLEGRKLVQRTARPAESRAAHAAIILTKKGRMVLDDLQALEGAAFGAVLQTLAPQDRTTLVGLLTLCVAAEIGAVERALAVAMERRP